MRIATSGHGPLTRPIAYRFEYPRRPRKSSKGQYVNPILPNILRIPSQHCDRSVIDHRFAMVFIQHFRPIFSPRPLGGTAEGNTPTPHLALEVSYVKSIAYGAHVFGDPKDVESNSLVHEWVMGLRQDGGGGYVFHGFYLVSLERTSTQKRAQIEKARTEIARPGSAASTAPHTKLDRSSS